MLRKLYRLSRKIICDVLFFFWSKERVPERAYSSILLCNLVHVGDVILATSVLPLLKKKYPNAKIGFLCGSWSKNVVVKHPLVDFVHIFDHARFNRSALSKKEKKALHKKTYKEALNEIKGKYEIAIDLYHDPYATRLVFAAGIKLRVGYFRGFERLVLTHPVRWRNLDQSIVAYNLALLEKLGIHEKEAFPNLPVLARAPDFQAPWLLFHIGTGAKNREWPVEKWRHLSFRCVERGYHLVFTGSGQREEEQLSCITQGLSCFTNLCNRLNFSEWVALIAKAKLVVNVNTSAGHVASAFQVPNIVLFTGIDKQEQWGPVNPKVTLLMKKVPCYPCYKGCEAMSCIREISVDEVLEEIVRKACV